MSDCPLVYAHPAKIQGGFKLRWTENSIHCTYTLIWLQVKFMVKDDGWVRNDLVNGERKMSRQG